MYEYLITLDVEVVAMWQRNNTAMTWIFVANRYLILPYAVLLMLSDQITTLLVSKFLAGGI
jgi:hypothetical protein